MLVGLAITSCGTQETLYCPEMSSGSVSAETQQCVHSWSLCGHDRDAVLMGQHRPQEGFSSLRLSCDAEHCTCEAGQRTQRFDRARACEALDADPKALVEQGCGWHVEYLDTMDPEVQFIDDMFACMSSAIAAVTVLALGAFFVWRRRGRSPTN